MTLSPLNTQAYVVRHVLPVAAELLPAVMDMPPAWALLVAIGRQESRFLYRRQLPKGPARGFWQFEVAGVDGVLEHPRSRQSALDVLTTLGYPEDAGAVHLALEHNDVLAACFARLYLWTDPRALPLPTDPTQGWLLYLATWRPGKPKPETWSSHFAAGWAATGKSYT